jgi:DNA-binding beta-propeller fold protein YncE
MLTLGAAEAQSFKTTLLAKTATTFGNPHEVVLSPDGRRLYVADVSNNAIKVLEADTLKTVGIFGIGDLSSPHDVTFDRDGRLLVADSGNDRIVVYLVRGAKAKKVVAYGPEMGSPEGVAVAANGDVYVTNASRHTILVLRDGRIVRRAGRYGDENGAYRRPHDIHIDHIGRIFAVDPGNERIQLLDPRLRVVGSLGGAPYDFDEPKYVAVDREGRLYIADEDNSRIVVLDRNYKVLGTIEGDLDRPEGVEVRGDRIWVADTHNDRILLYRLDWK